MKNTMCIREEVAGDVYQKSVESAFKDVTTHHLQSVFCQKHLHV